MTDVNTPEVLFEVWPTASADHFIGVATLNRPKQLNAISLKMCEMLLKQLRQWASQPMISAIVMRGAGDKGFSAGGDVAQVIRHVRGELCELSERYVYGDLFFTVEYELDLLIHRYPKPVISYSHGVCMGGGLGLIAGASHRVISDRSKVAMPEIHIGLFPDVGGGFFLNRVPGGAGTLLALTGMIVNEADALFAQLADYFVPQEEVDVLWTKLKSLAWGTDSSHALITDLLLGLHRKYHLGLPLSNLRQYYDAIKFICAQSSVEKISQALTVAAEKDPFFAPMAHNLNNGSPTAARVSYEYLRRAKPMSIEQVLELDLVLAKQYQRHHDFPEGVRALLIDKDKSPKWSPATAQEVTLEMVAGHFREPLQR